MEFYLGNCEADRRATRPRARRQGSPEGTRVFTVRRPRLHMDRAGRALRKKLSRTV